MPFTESVSIAVFMIAVVFLILFGLFLCIRLISFVLGKAAPDRKAESASSEPLPEPLYVVEDTSAGEVCLNNVDDKTAAMLMAIVADESGIPLSELRFKSIRELPSEENE